MQDRLNRIAELRPLLVTPVQAAAMLNVGRTTIYYLARDGALTPIRTKVHPLRRRGTRGVRTRTVRRHPGAVARGSRAS